jgi:hypothetical protein
VGLTLPTLFPICSRSGRVFGEGLGVIGWVPAATEKVIPALNRRALEASLPAVAQKNMATMAVVHIGPQEPCHHRRDFARVAQFHQQVKVVGHQAIMKDSKPESVAVSRHQVEECPIYVAS